MTDEARRYGIVLYELAIPQQMIEGMAKIFRENGELLKLLGSPVVPKRKKHAILGKIFTEPDDSVLLVHFLDKVCDAGCISEIGDIYHAWQAYAMEQEDILEAWLYYVTEPDGEQLTQMKQFLCKTYRKKEARITLVRKPELIGGFILKAGDIEYDYSLRGRMNLLRQTVGR